MTEIAEHSRVDDVAQTTNGTGTTPSAWGELLSSLTAGVTQRHDQWVSSVEDSVDRPLRELIDEVASKVESDTTALGKDREADVSVDEGADILAEYRNTVEREVISELARYLKDQTPGKRLATLHQELLSDLLRMAESLPETLDVAEAGQALRRRGGEGLLRLIRKAVARRTFSMRKAHPIPIQEIGNYHFQIRLPRHIVRSEEKAQYDLSKILARAEVATSKFTHGVLELQEEFDDLIKLTLTDRAPDDTEPDTDEPEEDASIPSPLQLLDQARERGTQFAEDLRAATKGIEMVLTPLSPAEISEIQGYFDYDVRAAGTFLLPRNDRQLPDERYLPAALVLKTDEAWTTYQEHSTNRIRLNQHVLRIRRFLEDLLDEIVDRTEAATIEPLREVHGRIKTAIQKEREAMEELFDQAKDEEGRAKLEAYLVDLSEEARERHSLAVSELGGVTAADDVLRDLGRGEWERSKKDVDQLPGSMSIHAISLESDPEPSVYARTSTVNLKRIVSEVLGLRFADQLKKPGQVLRRHVAKRWGEALTIVEIVSFGAEAASELLQNEDGSEGLSQAREYAIRGLDRTADRSKDASNSLDGPWMAFENSATEVLMNVWAHIHRRERAQELDTDQWGDIGSRLSVVAHSRWLWAKRVWADLSARFEVISRYVRIKTGVLIKRGQSAVGVTAAAGQDETATIDALRHATDIEEGIPRIYQRLFTFDTLEDPSFLENRLDDTNAVKSDFERWVTGGESRTLILSGEPGSGRTSFMNSLEYTVFEDTHLHNVVFDARVRNSEEVAAAIASELEIEAEGGGDLEDLAATIEKLPKPEKPIVCRLYNLEHIVLAIPGGVYLLKEFLVFLSRTDHVVYWIADMSLLCCQFVERTMLTAGFVRFLELTEFDRKSLEKVIMNRHRRGGMEIAFEPPPTVTTLMRQRLSRAETEEAKQEIIRNAFFERLAKLAGQNLRLALFYWLRSVSFDEESESVKVRWTPQLDFDFLADLDLQRVFSLRSFLLHQTLTSEEHSEIFRITEEQSILIMESLLNSGLIMPHPVRQDQAARRIDPGQRYRLHPLVLAPVKQQLIGQHIVY